FHVTGVQTCALPIYARGPGRDRAAAGGGGRPLELRGTAPGRARRLPPAGAGGGAAAAVGPSVARGGPGPRRPAGRVLRRIPPPPGRKSVAYGSSGGL